MPQNAKGSHLMKVNQCMLLELDLLRYRASYNTIKPDPSRLQLLINLRLSSTKRELKTLFGPL